MAINKVSASNNEEIDGKIKLIVCKCMSTGPFCVTGDIHPFTNKLVTYIICTKCTEKIFTFVETLNV